jgi:hypothetical protein
MALLGESRSSPLTPLQQVEREGLVNLVAAPQVVMLSYGYLIFYFELSVVNTGSKGGVVKKRVHFPVKLRALFRRALRIANAITGKIAAGSGIFSWPGNRRAAESHLTGKDSCMRTSMTGGTDSSGKPYQASPGKVFVTGFWNGFWRREAPPVKFPEIPTAEKIVADAWNNVGDHLRNAMADFDRSLPGK